MRHDTVSTSPTNRAKIGSMTGRAEGQMLLANVAIAGADLAVMTGNAAQVSSPVRTGRGHSRPSAPRSARTGTWSSRHGARNAGPGKNGRPTQPR